MTSVALYKYRIKKERKLHFHNLKRKIRVFKFSHNNGSFNSVVYRLEDYSKNFHIMISLTCKFKLDYYRDMINNSYMYLTNYHPESHWYVLSTRVKVSHEAKTMTAVIITKA